MQNAAKSIQTGDIIFQWIDDNQHFSSAVSQSYSSRENILQKKYANINHVGFYIGDNMIIESKPKTGVIKTVLDDFISSAKLNIIATVADASFIKHAIKLANKCISKTYNHTFIAEDEGFYCSELITHIFTNKNDSSYFDFIPMNFIHGVNDNVKQYWIDYYSKFNIPVPQGEMGSHPKQLLQQSQRFKKITII